MFYESNSFDKLQNALDDLHEESNKKGLKNSMFKKLFASLNLEIDELKLHASKLKNKIDCLNAKILDLTSFLEKFTQEQNNLNLLLRITKVCFVIEPELDITLVKDKKIIKIFFKKHPPISLKSTFKYRNNNFHIILLQYKEMCTKGNQNYLGP